MNKKMLLIAMFASMCSGLMAPPKKDKDGYYEPTEYIKNSAEYKDALASLNRSKTFHVYDITLSYRNPNYNEETKEGYPYLFQTLNVRKMDGKVQQIFCDLVDPAMFKID